jgi:4-alpha-glucanotransferase
MDLRPDRKLSGILAPLFALRGERDLGIGDVAALREAVDWAAAQGLGVFQVLPVNETGSDNSPYNAISSVALDPLTLEISAKTLPELSEEEIEEARREAFGEKGMAGPVNYAVVKQLKRGLLKKAFERFQDGAWRRRDKRARAFKEWMEREQAWLSGYGMFRVLMDEHGGSEHWDRWPMEHRSLEAAQGWLQTQNAAVRRTWEARLREVAYIQWVAWEQWTAVKAYAESKGVALMGDVPYGVSYYSADVFGNPEIFDLRWSCGAPPEPAFQQDAFTRNWGQNWGVPLYRWEVLEARQYDWWRQRVRKVREVFHLFRIDHALGFFRVYSFPWRPEQNAEFAELSREEALAKTGGELPHYIEHEDDSEEHKASNRAHGERILRVLLEETGPYRLIAEDLGTVPDYVRPSLKSMEVAGFKVPIWELDWDTSLVGGRHYERLSVATYATHDHPPLRSMWERWMELIAAGESGRAEDAAVRDWVWWEVRRLGRWAGLEVPCILPFEQVHEPLLRGLLASNSWLAISMITDFFGTSQRFNVPGAVTDSNWSERVELPVRRWSEDAPLAARMERLGEALRRAEGGS